MKALQIDMKLEWSSSGEQTFPEWPHRRPRDMKKCPKPLIIRDAN